MRKFNWFMLGILFSQAMFAQVKLGAKAGYLYSDASGDLDSRHYNGYTVGITSCIPVGSSSNIIGELLFSKRGYAVDNSVYRRFCGIIRSPPRRNERTAKVAVPAAPATSPTDVKIPEPTVEPTPIAIIPASVIFRVSFTA